MQPFVVVAQFVARELFTSTKPTVTAGSLRRANNLQEKVDWELKDTKR